MTGSTDSEKSGTFSPDEAFAVVAEETRLDILHVLGDADAPLAFSELYNRVEYHDSSNFDYHLDKLVGHFVRKTDGRYELQQAGRRVIEAILSGTITGGSELGRSDVDTPCYRCGEPLEIQYRAERLELYCSACGGTRNGTSSTTEWAATATDDIVGFLDLPPAGIKARTPAEALHAAEVWTLAESQALARKVCPRCSALVEHSPQVCENHDGEENRCDDCGQQFGVTVHVTCTNCVLEQRSVFAKLLLANTDLMAFMIEHGIDPIAPDGFHLSSLHETILSADPLEARFKFATGGDSITMTVDEELTVVDVTRVEEAGTAPR